MATKTLIERSDGMTLERNRGEGGPIGVILGVAVLALVAIVTFFLLSASHNEAVRTNPVTSAASTVANSASGAAKSVGDAAQSVVTH